MLALDIGSSSVRARIYDERGEPVGTEQRVRYESEPGGELDPVVVRDATLEVESAARGEHESVGAVATSCFWHSLLALDVAGLPLTPVLTWRDVRSAAQAKALAERLDGSAV